MELYDFLQKTIILNLLSKTLWWINHIKRRRHTKSYTIKRTSNSVLENLVRQNCNLSFLLIVRIKTKNKNKRKEPVLIYSLIR